MLTKEFAAKVGLSEKQVRKIVQHLEDRGYQLSKTEYRGREATDFQEEDIELFQEIAEKVKETNSYDQAFETLEQEKDFLQVLVKDEPTHQTPELQQLINELRTEVQHMRRERQMLGEMIQQVHVQQQKLEQTIALQAPKQSEPSTTTEQPTATAQTDEKATAQPKTATTEDKVEVSATQQVKPENNEDPSKVTVETKEEVKATEEKPETETVSPNTTDKKEETVENTTVANDEVQTPKEEATTKPETSTSAEEEKAEKDTDNSTKEENSESPFTESTPFGEPKQDEEPKKKGFFQRLFNI